MIAQLVKNQSAVQETPVRFLGWEEPLEKGKVTHSSILASKFWASLEAQLVKNPPAVQRPRFDLWVGKIPLRRKNSIR